LFIGGAVRSKKKMLEKNRQKNVSPVRADVAPHFIALKGAIRKL
jgi:hypothetical protein